MTVLLQPVIQRRFSSSDIFKIHFKSHLGYQYYQDVAFKVYLEFHLSSLKEDRLEKTNLLLKSRGQGGIHITYTNVQLRVRRVATALWKGVLGSVGKVSQPLPSYNLIQWKGEHEFGWMIVSA